MSCVYLNFRFSCQYIQISSQNDLSLSSNNTQTYIAFIAWSEWHFEVCASLPSSWWVYVPVLAAKCGSGETYYSGNYHKVLLDFGYTIDWYISMANMLADISHTPIYWYYIGILSTSKHSAWLDSVSVIVHYYWVPPQGGWGRHSNAAKSHNNGGRQSDGVLAARSKPFCQIGSQQNACHRLASQWRHTMSHESVLPLQNTDSLNIAP